MQERNYREGQFLDYIVPEAFDEVYDRVVLGCHKKHQELQDRVIKYRKYSEQHKRWKLNGSKGYDIGDFVIELQRAKEHLKKYEEANADYLI